MTLLHEDRDADKELAKIVNKIEDIQLGEFLGELELDENIDKKMRGLVEKLNDFSKEYNYNNRVEAHLEEIQDCLYGVVNLYNKCNKTPPRTSIVDL